MKPHYIFAGPVYMREMMRYVAPISYQFNVHMETALRARGFIWAW